MKLAYVDTSCLVALAFGEPGAEQLARRLQTCQRLFACNLLEAEFRAALKRERIGQDGLRLLQGFTWILPDRSLGEEMSRVLAAGYLRGADLWHLACALYLEPQPRELAFYSLDKAQAAVARSLGFPGQEYAAASPTHGMLPP